MLRMETIRSIPLVESLRLWFSSRLQETMRKSSIWELLENSRTTVCCLPSRTTASSCRWTQLKRKKNKANKTCVRSSKTIRASLIFIRVSLIIQMIRTGKQNYRTRFSWISFFVGTAKLTKGNFLTHASTMPEKHIKTALFFLSECFVARIRSVMRRGLTENSSCFPHNVVILFSTQAERKDAIINHLSEILWLYISIFFCNSTFT